MQYYYNNKPFGNPMNLADGTAQTAVQTFLSRAGEYRPLFFWRKENHIRQKELLFDILAAAEAFAWENKE